MSRQQKELPSAEKADRGSTTLVKRCLGCLQPLALTAFPLRSDRPGQRKSRCRICLNRITGIWRALNADYGKQWRQAHPEYTAAASREYRKRNLKGH